MLFFVDESGHPHPNDMTHRPVLGAVGIPVSRTRHLTQGVFALKRDILGDEDLAHECKYKANAILNERTFRREQSKWEYVESVFEFAANFPVVSCFVVMQKPTIAIHASNSHLPTHMRYLLKHINLHMQHRCPDRKAIVIFDGQDPGSDMVRFAAVSNFLFRHEWGRTWQCVMETPMFVDSRTQPGVQIADLFVSCVRQYHECRDGVLVRSVEYRRALSRLHSAVSATVSDYEDGDYTSYGEHFLNSWPEEGRPDGVSMGRLDLE